MAAQLPPAGASSPIVVAALEQVRAAGVELDALAMQALNSLPPDHAVDMLEYIAENGSQLRHPSKYITSTVAKGFVPRRGPTDGGVGSPPMSGSGPEVVESLRQKAEQAGLSLTSDALNALANLPPEHASEIVDFVLEKQGELRDPSNYIASTVARGYKSRRSGPAGPVTGAGAIKAEVERLKKRIWEAGVVLDDLAQQALDSLPPEHAAEMLEYVAENHAQLRNPSNYVTSTVARGFVTRKGGGGLHAAAHATGHAAGHAAGGSWGKGPPAPTPHHGAGLGGPKGGGGVILVPANATPLESRIHEINSHVLQPAQQLDFATYLALRCVDERSALELLEHVRQRAGAIGSPSNYVQAAVSKIVRGLDAAPVYKRPRTW